ncbi:FBP domain-containing protein [Nocardioides sp. zg-DK7169]|uniref:FBP domain-containing protein n=1 Tax=Nocardioides sp. zg-DK7169 TaxID=2736600 RepID=UPI0015534810|nr:FBP domain-containing protein [Nocardioides sp. zg-DK7169]NPC96868.1 FBP domain-containing protein [Nocardioides sp. zg-DK7169]
MEPLTSEEIRRSFVNCTKGEASRLPLPKAVPASRWEQLDFLGWRDAGAPDSAYLVVPGDAGPVGVVLRISNGAGRGGRKNMCAFCLTTHSSTDMALMVAPRAGAAGRAGNTVGTYLCADLACSLYARGIRRPDRAQPHETLSPEQRVERLRANVDTFMRRVLAPRP